MKHIIAPFEDFSFVADDLAVGGITSYGHKDFTGFGLAIQCAYEFVPGFESAFKPRIPVHHFKLDDTKDVEVHRAQELEVLRAVGLLHQARRQGLRVLVTCRQGRNRSALVAAEYLIQSGNRPQDVIAKIKMRRANSLMNPTFVEWLERAR